MTAGSRKSGHANLFEKYAVPELERFATSQHGRVTTDTMRAGDYWLLEECLRQLRTEMKLSATEWLDFLTKRLGFDREHLELARTIRDKHKNRESVSGMTVPEALAQRRKPGVKSKGIGQVRPRNGTRLPKVGTDTSSVTNGADRNASGHADHGGLPSNVNNASPTTRVNGDSSGAAGGSPMSRSRLVPREAITIRSYPEIEKVVERFFTGDDPRALMILGRPGIGKDEIFQKYARKYPGLVVDPPLSGLSKPLATYKAAFDNLHRLLIITDGEGLWGSDNGKELVRQFTEQKLEKWISWLTTCAQLGDYPQQYQTTSRVALILNRWISNPSDPFYEKTVDRVNLYHFDPTPYGIHGYVAEWFWDQEVFDFIASHLHHVVSLTCRAYNNAAGWKAAGEPWQRYFLARYTDDDPKWTVQQLENDPTLESVDAKVMEFMKATGLSRKTYFNYKNYLAYP